MFARYPHAGLPPVTPSLRAADPLLTPISTHTHTHTSCTLSQATLCSPCLRATATKAARYRTPSSPTAAVTLWASISGASRPLRLPLRIRYARTKRRQACLHRLETSIDSWTSRTPLRTAAYRAAAATRRSAITLIHQRASSSVAEGLQTALYVPLV